MLEKNNPYYLLFINTTGKDKIKLINKDIERCYEMLNHTIKIPRQNTKLTSEYIKQSINEFLNYLDKLGDVITEEEKRESMYNETKVYFTMLQLLSNNL